MDPKLTSDGKPWAPQKFKQLVKDRYAIAKHLNASYLEVGELSVVEKMYLVEIINREEQETQEQLKRLKENRENQKR